MIKTSSSLIDQLVVVFNPTHTNKNIAHASRCALRTYAKHIQYQQPEDSKTILAYVKKLDEEEHELVRKRAAEATKHVIEQVTASIMYLLLNSEDALSITVVKDILKKTGNTSGVHCVDHCISLMLKQGVITVNKNTITLL